MASTALKIITKTWPSVAEYFSVPHDEDSYKRLVDILDELIDEVGNDENHPRALLMETIGLLIGEYEDKHIPVKDAKPCEVLQYLMDEHEIKQTDLKEIGSQGVVSEILRGKRNLNVRQIKLLAKRFNTSPAVFI